jgi:PTH1 family peptidyl-tRNA hydrolase
MKLIIGLGNPGRDYETTRHNVGFLAVDAFANEEDGDWRKDAKRKAWISDVRMGREKIILAKPATYMNRSGEAASELVRFYKVPLRDLLVIHDDMDIAPGRIRFAAKGKDAGHKGVKDIQDQLGTTDIQRLRIGIGRPKGKMDAEDWVLGELSPEDAPNALDIISGMRDWIEYGTDEAANKWN